MISRISTLAAGVILLTATAGAQQRAARYTGSHARPVAIEQTAAATITHRNVVPTMPKGTYVPGALHDASAVARYTATAPMRVLGDGTTIYGSVIYSDGWTSGAEYGVYSFKADANPGVTAVMPQGSYLANGGGTLVDGKYYYNSYVYTEEMGYTFSTFCILDLETGEITRKTQSFMQDTFDQTQITHDLSYDATTGNIYAIAYIKETDSEGFITRFRPALSTMDSYTGFVTPIARTPELIAIACTKAGELYGISKGASSALYRINKTTGECTEIGKTGLKPEFVQSATFDPVTDKLYWAATELTGRTGLYEVDTTTGKASPICAFANNEEFTGLYIPEPVVEAGAPAAATELAAAFTGGSLSGKIAFTVPTVTYGGAMLTGKVLADVEVDGESFVTKEFAAGERAEFDVTLTEGIHNFTVILSTGAGESPRTGHAWYVGIDAPAAPGNLSLAPDAQGRPVISWTAPTEGRNGGYVDPSQLTYTVVREPAGVIVAQNLRSTTFTDNSTFESGRVYYTVRGYCGTREGLSASTGDGIYGQGSQLPVTFGFDTADDYKQCTVVDANQDWDAQYHWGGWYYAPEFSYTADDGGCAVYLYSPENAADDYIFMPPFTSEAGKLYRVTFTVWTRGDRETLAVTAGSLPVPSAQTEILAANVYSHKDKKEYTVEFRAAQSGNCFVGFHCLSDRKRFYLFLDDVTVDEVPDTTAPAAVSDLTVTPGAGGALSATISLKAPSTTAGGATLTSLTRIDLYRGNYRTAIHSFATPAPGAVLTWTDNAPVQGFNTYRAVAVNASGDGEKALATAYVGFDYPTAATDVTLTEENGKAVLRWTAPTTGQNGGYVDPAQLVYRIRRSDGTLMSSHAKGTEYVDATLDPAAKQYFIYYQVEPVSDAGVGDYALSNHIIFGNPYKGDFFESFADVATQNDPWVMYLLRGRSQLWKLQSQGYVPACPPADNDSGLAVFASSDGNVNDEGRMVSPKLYIKDMNVPVLAFAFYHSPDEGTIMGDEPFTDRLIPEVVLPDGSYVALDNAIYVDDPRYMAGWYLYTYRLSDFKQYDYVQLSFHGIAGYQNDVYIDYVSVEDNSEYDVTAYTFSGPTAVKVGRSGKYRFTVLNQGMNPAADYAVQLLRDGEVIQSVGGEPIASGATASFDFSVPFTLDDEGKSFKFTANFFFPEDEFPKDNLSGEIVTKVVAPDVPEVGRVQGTIEDNTVALEWTDADALHVSDSFETYTSFAIEDVGDYTLVDGDKGLTYTFSDIDFDYSGDPKGFQVFNPYTIYIAMLEEWRPHTGAQCMAAFSACDTAGKAIQSDDWLITPELKGGSTVSFFAKTANYEWGYETFEPMYSSTGTAPADFKPLASTVTTGQNWEPYFYILPADARYFAVHYNSNDKYVFYLDDMTYTARCTLDGEQLTGFRVYRDGTAIADLGADARSFTDTSVPDGMHTYGITALFGKRESKPVEVRAQVGEVGVDDVAAASFKVTAADGAILVDCAADARVAVADVAGRLVYAAAGSDSHRVAATAGVYIVKVNDKSVKVIVK